MTIFAARLSLEQVEPGDDLTPRFAAQGLLPVIVLNAADRMVSMLGPPSPFAGV